MKVYIIGPMRGLVGWNFSAFDLATQRLREAGYHPFSPAEACRAMGYAPNPDQGNHTANREHLKHVMLADVASIYASDAVALLPGWQGSIGSTVEVALAQFLGLKILDAVTLKEIEVRCKPWDLTTNFDREAVGKDSIQQQARSWEAVYRRLESLGMNKFFNLGDTGQQRAIKFINKLASVESAWETIKNQPGACESCKGTGASGSYWCTKCDGNGVIIKSNNKG